MNNLLPVIDLFKKSFDAYLKKVWLLAGIVLFGALGFVILLPFGLTAFLMSYGPFSHSDYNINLILIDSLLVLIGVFFVIAFGLLSQVAIFFAIKEENIDFKKALLTAWQKMGSFFWISFLSGLAILGGLILFVVPGIIFSVWFSFSIIVFVCEGLKGTLAMKRSKQLVQGYWWPVFGRIAVLYVVTLLISWIKFFGPIINVFFVGPFTVVYLFALYEDLKRVKA